MAQKNKEVKVGSKIEEQTKVMIDQVAFERLEKKVDDLIVKFDKFMESFKMFKLNYQSNIMNKR